MIVKQYSETVNLDEDVNKIKITIFDKQGKRIGQAKTISNTETRIPSKMIITYYRDGLKKMKTQPHQTSRLVCAFEEDIFPIGWIMWIIKRFQ